MLKDVQLTSLSSKGGCGCKIGPGELAEVLKTLPEKKDDPNLLVGLSTSDDAGVYRLREDLAIVQTVDFFTPIVNDPYMFGQIAAANALSDVYAMGGIPKTALNIVAYPIKTLDPAILALILKGAADKVDEAGAIIVGGHSIDDQEPKFGLAVTGVIDPEKIYKNEGALPGDVLVLTKPIGVGIMTTALKRGQLSQEKTLEVTQVMAKLNKWASELLTDFRVHSVTDVTGFGLLGHAYEMARNSRVHFDIDFHSVPILEGVQELAQEGVIPGGTKSNHEWTAPFIDYMGLDPTEELILCDAVTSGGLLISMPETEAEQYVDRMQSQGEMAKIIGEVSEQTEKLITVIK